MKRIINQFILCLIWILLFEGTIGAQELSKEKSFFYWIKMMNWTPEFSSIIYGPTFDKNNYLSSKSDEFEKNKYKSKILNIISDGINNINFAEKFTINGEGEVGEYNFDENYFPIKYWSFEKSWLFRSEQNSYFHYVDSRSTINLNEFIGIVKMSADQANAFIKSRKSPDGIVDRKIYLRATYSILDKPIIISSNRDISTSYFYVIDIYSDEAFTHKISSIIPRRDYFDKVHGILLKDGQTITYYNAEFKIVSKKEDAKFYRIINYTDGVITGPVRDYYISGKILMEGTYNQYYAENGFGNGLFTWFYENGQKSAEGNYSNGKRNGLFRAWHENGVMKEKVNYINEKMDGCHYRWDADGSCVGGTWSAWGYVDYYGTENHVASRKCPCRTSDKD